MLDSSPDLSYITYCLICFNLHLNVYGWFIKVSVTFVVRDNCALEYFASYLSRFAENERFLGSPKYLVTPFKNERNCRDPLI